jgi:hypothetical protein
MEKEKEAREQGALVPPLSGKGGQEVKAKVLREQGETKHLDPLRRVPVEEKVRRKVKEYPNVKARRETEKDNPASSTILVNVPRLRPSASSRTGT